MAIFLSPDLETPNFQSPGRLLSFVFTFTESLYWSQCADVNDVFKSPSKSFRKRKVYFLLHYFFFFRFPLRLLSSRWSVLIVSGASCFWSLDHSLWSCRSKSGVSSPSLTRRPARELSIPSPERAFRLLFACCLLPCVCKVLAMVGSFARIRRVIFWTPCWMVWSSSCWISRTSAVSGNMSMKR